VTPFAPDKRVRHPKYSILKVSQQHYKIGVEELSQVFFISDQIYIPMRAEKKYAGSRQFWKENPVKNV